MVLNMDFTFDRVFIKFSLLLARDSAQFANLLISASSFWKFMVWVEIVEKSLRISLETLFASIKLNKHDQQCVFIAQRQYSFIDNFHDKTNKVIKNTIIITNIKALFITKLVLD